jgi:hypothetical protein
VSRAANRTAQRPASRTDRLGAARKTGRDIDD